MSQSQASDPGTAPRLTLEGLDLRVGTGLLLRNLHASIGPGVTLVQGGDGRGKTSLLRAVAGSLAPEGGQIVLNGCHQAQDRAAYLAQVFWMEPQSTDFDALRGLEFLHQVRQRFARFDADQADALIDALDLDAHVEKPLYMLSTGSKRKVWFTAAVACHAPLTLLDMPFAALDKASIRCVATTLAQQARKGDRIWLIADYQPPDDVPLVGCIDLGD